MMQRLLPAIALIILPLAASPCLANMEYDGDLSVGHSDNVSNAIQDGDIFSDRFVAGNANIAKLWVPAVGRSFLLSGHFGFERFDESEGLDRLSYGASLAYIQRLGLGAYAPRIGLSLRADWRDFETDMRDGMLYRAGVNLEKRFLPELLGRIELSRERRTADEDEAVPYFSLAGGDVFNQEAWAFTAGAEYTLVNNSLLAVRYSYRDGDIDASTNPASQYFLYASQMAQDYQLCRDCLTYVTYKIDARVHALQLDWNWALGPDASVSFNLERRAADARGGITYTGNVFRIQLNKRF